MYGIRLRSEIIIYRNPTPETENGRGILTALNQNQIKIKLKEREKGHSALIRGFILSLFPILIHPPPLPSPRGPRVTVTCREPLTSPGGPVASGSYRDGPIGGLDGAPRCPACALLPHSPRASPPPKLTPARLLPVSAHNLRKKKKSGKK